MRVERPCEGVEIYCADWREVLPLLGRIDAVITDPPYGMKNNTDSRRFSGGSDEMQKRRQSQRDNRWPKIIGDDQPFDPSRWLTYPKAVLWGANHYAARLPVGTTLVWIKKLDGGFGTFQSDAEVAWMKGGHGVYCRRDTSFRANMKERSHPNEKPIGVMDWCIEKLNNPPVILDPFMGSGSTGIAAINRGLKFIGIEIEPIYFEAALRRIPDSGVVSRKDGR